MYWIFSCPEDKKSDAKERKQNKTRTICRSRMLRYVTFSIGLVVLLVSAESISLGVCHIAEQILSEPAVGVTYHQVPGLIGSSSFSGVECRLSSPRQFVGVSKPNGTNPLPWFRYGKLPPTQPASASPVRFLPTK